MSRRTRYFMIGAVAFLVVGLSIGTVAYYNGGFKALTRDAGPAELQLVPENATIVAFANVQQIMNSDFRRRMKEMEAAKGEQGQAEFKNATGIDIEKDIYSVVAYMTAQQGGDATQPSGAVIATGQFNQQRIADLIKSKGGSVGDYKGRSLMTFVAPHREGPSHNGALAFLSANQVAIGSEEAVRQTVDMAIAPGRNITNNDKMNGLITGVDNGNAWVVGRFDVLSKAHLPQQVVSQIPPISWFAVSGNIDGGFAGTVSVEANNADAAANLAKVVDGLRGLAALQAQSNPNVPSQFQQVLSSFALKQDGARLTLSFNIPSNVLDAFTQMSGKSLKERKK